MKMLMQNSIVPYYWHKLASRH